MTCPYKDGFTKYDSCRVPYTGVEFSLVTCCEKGMFGLLKKPCHAVMFRYLRCTTFEGAAEQVFVPCSRSAMAVQFLTKLSPLCCILHATELLLAMGTRLFL